MRNLKAASITIVIMMIVLTSCGNDSNSNNKLNNKDNDATLNNEIIDNTINEEVEEREVEQTIIEKLDDPTIATLVNKEYKLSDDYVPNDLVTVEVPTVLENPEVRQLRKVAADALFDMFEAAKEENLQLHARSGYRSYETQVQLFNSYKARNGEEAANRYSAKPGHSEHQTGLVMDITSESVNFQLLEQFGETAEGKWVHDNAHKYGFIIRYPKGMEHITGYIYEPWHLRYLGVELATAVYESNLTYEQFLDEEGLTDEVIAQ